MIFLEMLKNPAKLARNKLRDAEKQLVSKVFKKIIKDETTERIIDGKVSYLILKNHFPYTNNPPKHYYIIIHAMHFLLITGE